MSRNTIEASGVEKDAGRGAVESEQLGARAGLSGRLELLRLRHAPGVLDAGALPDTAAIAQSTNAAMIQPSQIA